MKNVLKNTLISLFISLVIFCLIGVVNDLLGFWHTYLAVGDYVFTKNLLATVVVGLGFGAPAAIYEKEDWPLPLRGVFHLGIGFTVYLAVAFCVGWIPLYLGPLICTLIVVAQLLFSTLIWLGFVAYYRREARQLNDAIRRER